MWLKNIGGGGGGGQGWWFIGLKDSQILAMS